ncbi:MAG: polyphosphate kinase 1 [Selenomonadaceae bacterium]|nr:polyphosphate kinase 1 [Selenomonadaceae bacterium]
MARAVDTSFTQNRELSWLKFNIRVLEEAMDESTPLFERLKFVEIFTSNLDEFFMVRVGSLTDLNRLNPEMRENKSLMTPKEQLDTIYSTCRAMYKLRAKVYDELREKFAAEGFVHKRMDSLLPEELSYVKEYLTEEILPALSPQIIDAHHPFPQLVSIGLYVGALLKYKRKVTLGIVPVPTGLSRMIKLPGGRFSFVLLEDLLSYFIELIFPTYPIIDSAVFAITRNADVHPDDEEIELEDYLEQMRRALKKRRSLSPVRLEISCMGDSLLAPYLRKRISLSKSEMFVIGAPLDLKFLYQLQNEFTEEEKSRLCYAPWKPLTLSERFGGNVSLMNEVEKRDILLSYPYDDFGIFLSLLKEAVYDKDVLSIKITVYRIGSSHAKLMSYLILASEMGKDVTVLLELRARFDEENNMGWANALKEAGCHILYGFEHYKVHAKICFITKRGEGKLSYITYIGTGNFNQKTAALYTDVALITADENIGRDAAAFFINMGISNLKGDYHELLVAPYGLKNRILELIEEEQAKGKDGSIILKMNSLTDRDIIDKLSEAGRAGVRIKMIIRGICCLLPNVPEKTENISVRSIVGRFLEHARIFVFGKGKDEKVYISSADFMTRNTEKRVEIAAPVKDKKLREELIKILEFQLKDDKKARFLTSQGTYEKPESKNDFSAQDALMRDKRK